MATADAESPHQRFFALTNEGDPRQVYALDTRCDAPAIFFLGRGGATSRVRQDTRDGAYACPVPDCPCPTFKMVRAGSKRDHFVHEFDPGRDHLQVTPSFYVSRLIGERLMREGFHVVLDATLARDVVVDVLVEDENESLLAIFVTSRRLSEATIKAQSEAARRLRAAARWIFCVPGPLADVRDVHRKDFTWLVARQNRGIWINPIEREVFTQPTGPNQGASLAFISAFDEWDMDELGVGHLIPVQDRSQLRAPESVWITGSPGNAGPALAEVRDAAVAALVDAGLDGVLLVTDQPTLGADLAALLEPEVQIERVAIEGVTRETLGDRLVLVLGLADFVEHASIRVPEYAEPQTLRFISYKPATMLLALRVIATGVQT